MSTQTTHTPGPWEANDTLLASDDIVEVFHVRDETGEKPVADVYSYENRDEARANAVLISAAPEMLEALQQALVALDMDDAFGADIDARHVAEEDAYHLLTSAIAKATGAQ